MSRFWIDEDAEGEPTVWAGSLYKPMAILRRCEVSADETTRDEVLWLIAGTRTAPESTPTDETSRTVFRDRGQIIGTLTARNAELEAEVERLRGLSAPVADLMQELDLAKGDMERMRDGAHHVGRISMAAVEREKAMRARAEAAEATLAKVAAAACVCGGISACLTCQMVDAALASAGRPATSNGEGTNGVHVGGCNERCVGGFHVVRCDQCGNPPGECVNDAGDVIGDCYRPASSVVAPSATDEGSDVMPQDAGDEIGAPALCAHCATVVRNLFERDHIDDRESERVAAELARQCCTWRNK